MFFDPTTANDKQKLVLNTNGKTCFIGILTDNVDFCEALQRSKCLLNLHIEIKIPTSYVNPLSTIGNVMLWIYEQIFPSYWTQKAEIDAKEI